MMLTERERNDWRWVWEVVVGYFILVVVNLQFFPGNKAFYHIYPHPYMVLILLMGARYGLLAGLVSSTIAGFLVMGWIQPGAQFQVWQLPGDIAQQVIMFLIAGLIFGWLRTQNLQHIRMLQRENQDVNRQVTQLTDKLAILEDINRQLEIQTLGRVDTFARLYSISHSLAQDEVSVICERVPHLLAEHLQAERCSVYLAEESELVLQSSFGWNDQYDYPPRLPLDRGLIGLACKERRVASIREILDRPQDMMMAGTTIICAPLLDERDNVMGLINIESMPFLNLNQSQVTIFETLAKWVSQAINHASYIERVRKHTVTDILLDLYTREFLEKRLGEEIHRAQTHDLPITLALLKLTPLENQSTHGRIDELRIMTAYLRRAVREIDIVTRYSDSMPIAVLMTTTEMDEGEALMMQCCDDLNMLLPPGADGDRVSLGIASYGPESRTARTVQEQAEASFG